MDFCVFSFDIFGNKFDKEKRVGEVAVVAKPVNDSFGQKASMSFDRAAEIFGYWSCQAHSALGVRKRKLATGINEIRETS